MTKAEIEKIIIEELSNAQMEAGEEKTPIKSVTVPIGDLPGFDSLSSVAVTCQCLDRLEIAEHTKIASIFIGKDKKDNSFALNVAQVANYIVDFLV